MILLLQLLIFVIALSGLKQFQRTVFSACYSRICMTQFKIQNVYIASKRAHSIDTVAYTHNPSL